MAKSTASIDERQLQWLNRQEEDPPLSVGEKKYMLDEIKGKREVQGETYRADSNKKSAREDESIISVKLAEI